MTRENHWGFQRRDSKFLQNGVSGKNALANSQLPKRRLSRQFDTSLLQGGYKILSVKLASVILRSNHSAIVLALIATVPLAFAQSAAPPAPAPDPTLGITFDVVSIKPVKEDPTHYQPSHITDPPDGDGITVENSTMLTIVRWNFNNSSLRQSQLQGVPDWFTTDNYDIRAKVANSDIAAWQKLSDGARRLVFRKMLVERFKFAWHFADIDSPVYNLVIAKGGLKIKEAKPDEVSPYNSKTDYPLNPNSTQVPYKGPGMAMGPAPDGYPMFVMQQESMSWFAKNFLSRVAGRQVIDKTDLTGAYNFTLIYTGNLPGDSHLAPDAPGVDRSYEASVEAYSKRPDLFTALQEQLGLKLEQARGPLEMMVVDHIERPSEN